MIKIRTCRLIPVPATLLQQNNLQGNSSSQHASFCVVCYPEDCILGKPSKPYRCHLLLSHRFFDQAIKEDKHFVISSYALSKCASVKDLPPVIDDMENLPEEHNYWLPYSPNQTLGTGRGYLYHSVDGIEHAFCQIH